MVGEAASGPAAVSLVRELSADVIFLDIRLPELDGFEVLTALHDRRPPVIVFTTASASMR